MRLDKLRIGSEKPGDKQRFKNLKNVEIDFDEHEWITVVIGWNGTGKSNVLEALAALFRDLIMEKDQWGNKDKPSFAYELRYICHGKDIVINADPDCEKEAFQVSYFDCDASASSIEGTQSELFEHSGSDDKKHQTIKFSEFKKQKDDFLPKYVFGYYSGYSDRMQSVFRPYLQQYDKKLRNAKSEDPGLRRLFYALPVHSQFVLLAFVLQQDALVKEFLDNQLGLDTNEESESVDSVLLVLNEPSWNLNKSKDPKGEYGACKENPDIFWGAEGVVRSFLNRVHQVATAPIRNTRKDDSTFWNKKSREYVYLFIKDLKQLSQLVGDQKPREFFRDLESTYVSELISEVRIRVKLKKNDGSVTFRELSEGEQQLLTVLGLLRFTAEEESLFLLDEPDTHLNPRWSVDYIDYLNRFVTSGISGESSSHIVLTTHNPIAIAELKKQQVQILHRDPANLEISAQEPDFDPRGMGYAGIITSDMFGLDAALDTHTQDLLEEKRKLGLLDELTEDQKERLGAINMELEGYGFRYASRDPVFEEYLRARYEHNLEQPSDSTLNNETREKRSAISKELVKKAMARVKEKGHAQD
ncbi:MAG: AAA family ATPase [Pseudomonadales bacterium]|nr:AAA family ATPase [Pseudomonadales bacterium]